jgi:hypothetical protein
MQVVEVRRLLQMQHEGGPIQLTEVAVLWKHSYQVRRFELELVAVVAAPVSAVWLQPRKHSIKREYKVNNAKTFLLIHRLSSLS